MSLLPCAVHSFQDAVSIRQEELLVARGWIRYTGRADAFDRRGQCIEEIMRQSCGDLSAKTHEGRRLVDDNRPARLAYRRADRIHIEWRQAAQVNDLQRDAFGGGGL